MCTAKSLARWLLFAVVLGAWALAGCGAEKSAPLNNQCADPATPGCQDAGADSSGGGNDAPVSCAEICAKADFCCMGAMPLRDGGLNCEFARGCGTAASDDNLIAQCQAYIALFPLNPACQ